MARVVVQVDSFKKPPLKESLNPYKRNMRNHYQVRDL